jgi:hypothetical protein
VMMEKEENLLSPLGWTLVAKQDEMMGR